MLQDQLAALVGHSGTISAGAVVTVICCLLVVNAVFYLGFMHLIYHILLRCCTGWWQHLVTVSCGEIQVLTSKVHVCVFCGRCQCRDQMPSHLQPLSRSNMGYNIGRPPRIAQRFLRL